MTDALLLDTHIALWPDSCSERLRPSTRTLIDACWRDGGTMHPSAIMPWEIALLVDTGRIALDVPMDDWMERVLDRPGVTVEPRSHRAACRAYRLHHLEHRDPADRLLIATAIERACPLVTYDERIARFAERHGTQSGLSIAA